MSSLSLLVITGVVGALLVLGGLTLLFLAWSHSWWAAAHAKRRGCQSTLTFHSPDDAAPRSFRQSGLVSSAVGTALLCSWFALPAIGYAVVVIGCALSYYPEFYKPRFGNWDGLMGPWMLVFFLTHLLAAVVITFHSTMQFWFMRPAAKMSDATHVLIEEELHVLQDEDLPEPGAEDAQPVQARRLQRWLVEVQRSLARLGQRTLVPVHHKDGGRQLEYTCVRYSYDEEAKHFRPSGTAPPTPVEAHAVLRAGGLSDAEAEKVRAACGKNEIHVHVPTVPGALMSEFMGLVYVFQSIGTWAYMAFSSWNIGIVWLFMMIASGCTRSLLITRRSKKKLAELAQLHAPCTVLRGGSWCSMDSTELVLGDIVQGDISAPMPCDGVVLEGSLVVNESMLTGEPMPVQKAAVANSQNEAFGKKNLVHAGTCVLQSAGPHGGGAVLMVTAVGALTARGQLIRMVLFPSSVRFKYNDQLPLVYLIMSGYVILLALCYIFLTRMGSVVVTILAMLTKMAMCLSPMLPVSMMMGQVTAARRLSGEHKIRCLQPGRIPVAGKISTMVFDKTGTITKDGMDLACVISVQDQKFGERTELGTKSLGVRSNAEALYARVSEDMRHALASCHTVTSLEDGTLVGNQVEIAMVRACGWQLGPGGPVTSPAGDEALEVLKQLDFDHQRTTSGAVVRCRHSAKLKVFIKGSCERIKELVVPGSLPAEYLRTAECCARENFYTLAVAAKAVPPCTSLEELREMPRDELEAGIHCCGLLLFRNEMKADSPEALRQLSAGSVRSVMCTGDNALTGIAIGRQSGIVAPGKVLLGDVDAATGRLVWTDPDCQDAASSEGPGMHAGELAVTHAAWRHLHATPELLEGLWRRIVVFARMKPEDKVTVVKYLQGQGLVVGMCGDGGNDCGALRVSHAGLALSEAEASLVSPFCTSRDGKSLVTVVDLIREGRACLATNLATFQYFIVYAFCVTLSGISGTVMGNWGGAEFVWLLMDILVGVIMVSTMTHSGPTKALASYRPTASLLGYRTIAAIAFPVITWAIAQTAAFALLRQMRGYEYVDPVQDLHVAPKDWPKFGDNYDSATISCCRVIALITTAYVSTYGGAFRCNILRNLGINVVYGVILCGLYYLCLTTPTVFSCIFRINCDTTASLGAQSIPILSQCSAGTGGCFLGSQLMVWQEAMNAAAQNSTGEAAWWTPDPRQGCLPSEAVLQEIPFDDDRISSLGCRGPNNCWSHAFKIQMVAIITAYVVANHLFVKVALLGPVAARLRRRYEAHAVKKMPGDSVYSV